MTKSIFTPDETAAVLAAIEPLVQELGAAPAPARAQRVDRHWNDDSSLTIYIDGRKVRRFGGDENEDASEEEIEDPEGAAERFLTRRHPKRAGGWVWGRTTHGHNWHTKKAKAARLAAEAAASKN